MTINKKLFTLFCLGIFFGYCLAGASEEPVYLASPARLPGILPEMHTAGFWIARHPYPDSLLMTTEQIAAYNLHTNRLGTVTKIWQHSSLMNGSTVRNQIADLLSTLFARGSFASTGPKFPNHCGTASAPMPMRTMSLKASRCVLPFPCPWRVSALPPPLPI